VNLRAVRSLFVLGVEHRGSDGDRGREGHPAARAPGWRFDHDQQLTFVIVALWQSSLTLLHRHVSPIGVATLGHVEDRYLTNGIID